jgi:hypothetical protein
MIKTNTQTHKEKERKEKERKKERINEIREVKTNTIKRQKNKKPPTSELLFVLGCLESSRIISFAKELFVFFSQSEFFCFQDTFYFFPIPLSLESKVFFSKAFFFGSNKSSGILSCDPRTTRKGLFGKESETTLQKENLPQYPLDIERDRNNRGFLMEVSMKASNFSTEN